MVEIDGREIGKLSFRGMDLNNEEFVLCGLLVLELALEMDIVRYY